MKNLLINRALAAKKKKIFTLLLAVTASIGTMSAAITVRLDPSSCTSWSTVRLWAWTDNGNIFDSWPGQIVSTDDDGWYSYTFDEDITSVSIIWNNGDTYQTVDIEGVISSTCYALNSTLGKAITVSVVNCSSGSSQDGTPVSGKYKIGNLYYNLDATNNTAEVTYKSYNDNNYYYPYNEDWNVTTANIPSSVTYNSVTYSVKSIGDYAFAYCSSLTSVTIPNSVTSIGECAFYKCFSLTSITIPNSVTGIGYRAFSDCSSLTSVTIPNSVTSIGNSAFWRCSSLTSVTIPNSVTSIGSYAFSECSSLTSVTIPNSVTSIGWFAFSGCCSLTSVTIGNGVTSIEADAFSECSSLTSITIPNSVTSIGENAFWGCSSLTSITIPNSVKSIGDETFSGCSKLTSVTIEAETPPTLGSDAFNHTNNCPIYVPCGTLDAYKTAWSAYASRIKYAPYSSYTINKKTENGHITTSSSDFTMCDTEHPVICTATPNRGYYFVRWADGNTENPRTIELTQDTTMEAIFDYLLTGKCGKDSALTWTLDTTTMALNITGNGALSENYTYAPFIQSLTIGNGVTSIGYGAFSECTSLTSVTIPNSVTSIGSYAFGECESLKTVVLGSSVKVLETAAFAYCSALETITCYSMRPPTVNQDALYGLDYSTIVYVPADYLNTYKMHDAWGLYDVRPLGATSAETEDVKITPSENEANVTWPSVTGAASYELVIKDKDGNIVCTLIFNANGQLTSIAFNAPSRNGAPAQTQSAGFSFTITGLDSGTYYDLTLTAKDNSGNIIEETTIPFHTDYPEGIENVQGNELQSTKVVKDGQVLILRNGKTYTMQGQEVK